ncbi:MAG: radical SAM protein [Nanoarchaeota archaeon]
MQSTLFAPVYERHRDAGLFLAPKMHAPLAEQTRNVVQFELTVGCSHNRCTYCDLYKGARYYQKPLEEYQRHVRRVLDHLNAHGESRGLERIFIGSGDPLRVETSKLIEAIMSTIDMFEYSVGDLPRRLSMYGSVQSILIKGVEGLKQVHCGGTCKGSCSVDKFNQRAGLDLIYLGLETGDDDLLRAVKKGHTRDELNEAIDIVRRVEVGSAEKSHLRVSAFIMPGLGGKRFAWGHVIHTVQALQRLRPEFINIMTIGEHPDTDYARMMDEEGIPRLTDGETALQLADIVEGIGFPTTLGCFDNSGYLGSDTNPVKFPSMKIVDHRESRVLAERIRSQAIGLEPQLGRQSFF